MTYIDKKLPTAAKALLRAGAHLQTKDEGDPFGLLTKKFGDLTDETLKRIGATDTKLATIKQCQLELDQKMARGLSAGSPIVQDTWGKEFTTKMAADIAELSRANGGKVLLDVKATLTTGVTSGGSIDVPMRDNTSMLPTQRLLVRSLLNVIQTDSGTV